MPDGSSGDNFEQLETNLSSSTSECYVHQGLCQNVSIALVRICVVPEYCQDCQVVWLYLQTSCNIIGGPCYLLHLDVKCRA